MPVASTISANFGAFLPFGVKNGMSSLASPAEFRERLAVNPIDYIVIIIVGVIILEV